jgi:Yip1 domain
MTEATLPLPPEEQPRRFQFDWVMPALFKPRSTFAKIAAYEHSAWLTPLLLLTVLAIASVLVAAPIRSAQVQMNGPVLPEGFETWPPEQQQAFFESQSATQGPLFTYGFPILGALAGTWIGWLATFGILHLLLTLLGGRGSTRSTMNIVAWASLPFVVRDIIRIGYMLMTQKVIAAPGISGFAGTDGFGMALAALLANVDIYLIWFVVLVVLGITVSDKVSGVKAFSGVLITLIVLGIFPVVGAIIGVAVTGLTSGPRIF